MPFSDEEGLPFDIYNVVLYDFAGLPTYQDFEEDDFKALIQSLLCRQPTDRATFQSLPGGSFLHWQALWSYTVTARLSKRREWLSSAQLKCAFCPACEGSTISWMCCQCFLRLIFLFRNSGRQWFYSDWFFGVYQHIWISKSPTAIGFLGFINTSGSARGLVDPSESKNSNEDKASEEREVSPVRFLLYHTYILHTHTYIYMYIFTS